MESLLTVIRRHGDLRLGLEVIPDVVGREAVARASQEVVPALRSAARAPLAAHQVQGLHGNNSNITSSVLLLNVWNLTALTGIPREGSLTSLQESKVAFVKFSLM